MNTNATLSPPVCDRDHIEGRASARLTLVEFGDYQCPYCAAAYPIVKRLQRDLGSKLRFVFRNFPLIQAHPCAMAAAEAAEAAALQGKFWEMHDVIYENQDQLDPSILPLWAQQLRLDVNEFRKAIKDGLVTQRIKDDRKSGIRSGVNGTPCLFINGVRFDGAADYEQLREALEAEQ
jgi:protein-disulfide isomerase